MKQTSFLFLILLLVSCSNQKNGQSKNIEKANSPEIIVTPPEDDHGEEIIVEDEDEDEDEEIIVDDQKPFSILDIKTNSLVDQRLLDEYLSFSFGVCATAFEQKNIQLFLLEIDPEIFQKSFYYYFYESKSIAKDILDEFGIRKKLESFLTETEYLCGIEDTEGLKLKIIDITTNELASDEVVLDFLIQTLELSKEEILRPEMQEILLELKASHLQKYLYIFIFEDKKEAQEGMKKIVFRKRTMSPLKVI